MPPVTRINGVDIATQFGASIYLPDRLVTPKRSIPTVGVPGRLGHIRSGTARSESRILTAQAWIGTPSTTASQRVALESDLTDLVYSGLLQIRCENGQGDAREIWGETLEFRPEPRGGFHVNQASQLTWQIQCLDPAWYQLARVLRVIGTARTSIPCGTLPTGFILVVHGPTSNPFVATWRRANGGLITTMSFALGLTTGEYAVLDGYELDAWKVLNGGTPSSINDTLTGDWPPAGISPEDAWRQQASYVTLELSSGVGELFTVPAWAGAP